MADLFEKQKQIGFTPDVAQQLVELHLKNFQYKDNTVYPFNHIKSAAYNGKTHIIKPQKGLSLEKANILSELGYGVDFNLEKNQWKISWE